MHKTEPFFDQHISSINPELKIDDQLTHHDSYMSTHKFSFVCVLGGGCSGKGRGSEVKFDKIIINRSEELIDINNCILELFWFHDLNL